MVGRVLVLDSSNIQLLLKKERVVFTKRTHLDILRYLHYDTVHALVSKKQNIYISLYLIELQHFFADAAANYYFCILILLIDLQIVSTYYRMKRSSRGSEDISKIYSVTLALVSTEETITP